MCAHGTSKILKLAASSMTKTNGQSGSSIAITCLCGRPTRSRLGGLPPILKEKGRVKKYAPETTPNIY
jgi:hypothetical protein